MKPSELLWTAERRIRDTLPMPSSALIDLHDHFFRKLKNGESKRVVTPFMKMVQDQAMADPLLAALFSIRKLANQASDKETLPPAA